MVVSDAIPLPIWVLILILGFIFVCLFLFFTTSNGPVPWILCRIVPILEVFGSLAWFQLEAGECVAVLESLGLIVSIPASISFIHCSLFSFPHHSQSGHVLFFRVHSLSDSISSTLFFLSFFCISAILGLTLVAIGDSVGDFVADTSVAQAGLTKMGFASAFASPMFNQVMGLSISLIIGCALSYPNPFVISMPAGLYVCWGFLYFSLFCSLIAFPWFHYQPPRWFAVALILLYVVFMIVNITLQLRMGLSL